MTWLISITWVAHKNKFLLRCNIHCCRPLETRMGICWIETLRTLRSGIREHYKIVFLKKIIFNNKTCLGSIWRGFYFIQRCPHNPRTETLLRYHKTSREADISNGEEGECHLFFVSVFADKWDRRIRQVSWNWWGFRGETIVGASLARALSIVVFPFWQPNPSRYNFDSRRNNEALNKAHRCMKFSFF
jgi:hypothetical protein